MNIQVAFKREYNKRQGLEKQSKLKGTVKEPNLKNTKNRGENPIFHLKTEVRSPWDQQNFFPPSQHTTATVNTAALCDLEMQSLFNKNKNVAWNLGKFSINGKGCFCWLPLCIMSGGPLFPRSTILGRERFMHKLSKLQFKSSDYYNLPFFGNGMEPLKLGRV